MTKFYAFVYFAKTTTMFWDDEMGIEPYAAGELFWFPNESARDAFVAQGDGTLGSCNLRVAIEDGNFPHGWGADVASEVDEYFAANITLAQKTFAADYDAEADFYAIM